MHAHTHIYIYLYCFFTCYIIGRFQSVGTEVISPTGEQTSSPSSSSPQPDTSEPKENTPLYKGSAGFKPFASDPEKQARYEKYLASKAKGNTGKVNSDLML